MSFEKEEGAGQGAPEKKSMYTTEYNASRAKSNAVDDPWPGEPHVLIFDLETRSACDLKAAGAHKYAADPTTDVWCAAYCVDDGPVQLWTPSASVPPPQFVEAARNPAWKVVAFTAPFERNILAHVLAPRYGWSDIPLERFACLQASSLALALPSSLGGVASALGLAEEKDEAGKRLMREMARPRRPSLDEDPDQLYWHCDPDRLQRLYKYCLQDITVTQEIWKRIGLLPGDEQAVWVVDQRINDRGIRIDRKLAEGAAKIAASASAEIDAAIEELTDGEVGSSRQVTKLLAWLEAQGLAIDSARVDDVEKALARTDLSPAARRVLECRRDGAHIAGAKFSAMLAQAGDGDRVRGAYKYHGAHTGRWSATGVQPQNLKKPPKDFDLAEAIELVTAGDYEQAKQKHKNPLGAVGNAARTAFAAAPGHRYIAADFSGVESRVLAWLAGETSKLKLWFDFDAGGDDPYLKLGLSLGFAKDVARPNGKTADLAFGFGGGKGAYRKFGNPDATDDEIKRLQKAWRDAHPRTFEFWFALERATKRAMANPDKTQIAGKLALQYDGRDFLRIKLPSGRKIAYPHPLLEDVNKFGKAERIVPYEGFEGPSRRWTRLQPWFGKWVENVVQSVARDVFSAAMLRLEAAGYAIVAHTHDEIVCEVPEGFGSEDEFGALMVALPDWASGLPVATKARSGPRFIEIEPDEREPASDGEAPWEDEAPPSAQELPATEPNSPPWADDAPPIADAPEQVEAPRPSAAASAPETPSVPPRSEPAPRPSASWSDDGGDGYFTRRRRGTGRVVATYYYDDPEGQRYHRKERKDTHEFPHSHWDAAKGIWKPGKPPGGVYYLYGVRRLLEAPPDAPVWVCEGEKDADTLAALGLIAVTNPNGGGNFSGDFTRGQLERWFRGRTVVYAPEDNDAKGRAHVEDIGKALSALGCEVRIIPFRDLAEHGDVSDWLATGRTKEELLARPWRKWGYEDLHLEWFGPDTEMPEPRGWLLKAIFCRQYLSQLVASGGTGKTSLRYLQWLSLALGRPLTGEHVFMRCRVVILCFEDGRKELIRRLQAACQHHDIDQAELEGWLAFRAIGPKVGKLLTKDEHGRIEDGPLRAKIERMIATYKPDLIGFDPFVKVHGVGENHNDEIDVAATILTDLAIEHDIAVDIIHHTGKKRRRGRCRQRARRLGTEGRRTPELHAHDHVGCGGRAIRYSGGRAQILHPDGSQQGQHHSLGRNQVVPADWGAPAKRERSVSRRRFRADRRAVDAA